MFEQIDGILACLDLRLASCGALVYLYMGSKTALCTSTWASVPQHGPCVPNMWPSWAIWGPSGGRFGAIFGPFWPLGLRAFSCCVFLRLRRLF